ncbi:hypothetical protein B0H12DRAFT_1081498 [Mycena haematopus]|nr:hypothetical protein B0H12DRAFT_1081498 [Mycena haematopus]
MMLDASEQKSRKWVLSIPDRKKSASLIEINIHTGGHAPRVAFFLEVRVRVGSNPTGGIIVSWTTFFSVERRGTCGFERRINVVRSIATNIVSLNDDPPARITDEPADCDAVDDARSCSSLWTLPSAGFDHIFVNQIALARTAFQTDTTRFSLARLDDELTSGNTVSAAVTAASTPSKPRLSPPPSSPSATGPLRHCRSHTDLRAYH